MTTRHAAVSVRRESPADAAGIRQAVLSAFPDDDEADLVDALRADSDAWIDGLSWVAIKAPDAAGTVGRVVGHARGPW